MLFHQYVEMLNDKLASNPVVGGYTTNLTSSGGTLYEEALYIVDHDSKSINLGSLPDDEFVPVWHRT